MQRGYLPRPERRKPKLTKVQAEQVRKLYAAKEMTVAAIGALFGISRESVYRYVRERLMSTHDTFRIRRRKPWYAGRTKIWPDAAGDPYFRERAGEPVICARDPQTGIVCRYHARRERAEAA